MLTILKIGLLVILWLFILLAMNVMRADTGRATGMRKRSSTAVSSQPVSREKASRIVVVEGPLKGSHMDISTIDQCVVGRHEGCDFVLGDDFASSRHARFFRRGSAWFVEDLESRNGTYISGERIEQPEQVRTGTDVRMGRSTVRLMP